MNAEEFATQCKRLGLNPADFREKFSHASGHGGQNVNKVATAVELMHVPTGLSVKVQDSRFQGMNRALARERLLAQFAADRERRRLERAAAVSKSRRQRAKRSKATKRKMVEGKRHRAEIKQNRRVKT
ncbi:MAG: peptide chain release factor-like protein [Verrucomicrobiales bacterium]|jgi:protein subunit release factor B|nr:peptide chain release factor-like protein [Verrucomicrobiales bacterium]